MPKPGGSSDSGPLCANTGIAMASAPSPIRAWVLVRRRVTGLAPEPVCGDRDFDRALLRFAALHPCDGKQPYENEGDDNQQGRQGIAAAACGLLAADLHDPLWVAAIAELGLREADGSALPRASAAV